MTQKNTKSRKPMPFQIGTIKSSFPNKLKQGHKYTPKQTEKVIGLMKRVVDPQTGDFPRGFMFALKNEIGVNYVSAREMAIKAGIVYSRVA